MIQNVLVGVVFGDITLMVFALASEMEQWNKFSAVAMLGAMILVVLWKFPQLMKDSAKEQRDHHERQMQIIKEADEERTKALVAEMKVSHEKMCESSEKQCKMLEKLESGQDEFLSAQLVMLRDNIAKANELRDAKRKLEEGGNDR